MKYYMVMCHLFFEKDEHFYKFITLQFLTCKKYSVKRTFKDSKNWSKVIHSSLKYPPWERRPTIMQSFFHSCNFFADFFVHVMVFWNVVCDCFKLVSIMP